MQHTERELPEEIDPDSFLAYDFSGIEADNQRYRLALESIDIGVFEYYAPIDHFEANYIWYQLTGIRRGDGISELLANIPENNRQELTDILCKNECDGRLTFTSRYRHPEKGERWLSGSGFVTALNGTPQTPLHFSGTLIDITDWKNLQEEYVETENIQNTTFDNIPVGMIVIDAATKIIEQVNPFGAKMLGMMPVDVVGKRCHHFLCTSPEGFCPVCDLGQQIDGVEKTIIRADGFVVWVLKSVIKFKQGKKEKLLECFFDITPQKKTEDDLRSMTDRLTLATRAGGVGIWDYDIKKGTEEWDDQMYRLYSANRADFPSGDQAWLVRIHPDDMEFQNREIERAVTGEKDYSSEFRIVWPDGSTHIIRAIAVLQTDQMGTPTHLVGTNWDITQQKETENELIRSNLHLESASIRANRLMVEAEAANVAKSAFLATISHEIRTPMNGVIGMAGLLLDTILTAEQRQYTELLKSSGEALLSLINDVLDFSKMEARKFVIEDSDFNLHQTIATTISMMEIHATGKSLELTNSIEENVPDIVRGDANRLRQILVNLIGNAIKFTDRGGVTVRARLESQSDSAIVIRFAVIDTGIGIAPEKQKMLFSPFSQLDSTSTRRFGGTGLGLAISRQLSELMGGKIGVVSDGINGTTFWFTVKFNCPETGQKADIQSRRAEPPGIEPSRPPVLIQKMKPLAILLAEDNRTNQIIAVKLLEKLGQQPDVVENGMEAVEAEKKKAYDIIIMDCQMPEMDGYEATRKIREYHKLSGTERYVPIVAMTAHALQGDREKCIASGMDDYMVKPITPEILATMLDRWKPMPDRPEKKNGPAVFDHSAFYSRIMNDASLAQAVIAAFLDDIPVQLSSLGESAGIGDFESAERYAHRIRGAAANLSCNEIRDFARECETAALEKNKTKLDDSAKRLNESFKYARTVLEAFK